MAASIEGEPAGKPQRMSPQRDETDPAEDLERQTDELEARTQRLGEHLDEAKEKLEDRAAEAQRLGEAEDVVGDFHDTDDQAGGEDPVGAHAERDEAAEDDKG
jgi:hypothetical protein